MVNIFKEEVLVVTTDIGIGLFSPMSALAANKVFFSPCVYET